MIAKEMSQGSMLFFTGVILFLLSPLTAFANLCQADFNNDGSVDGTDLMVMSEEMGRDNCAAEACKADLNGDGRVDDVDNAMINSEYGRKDCLPGDGDALWEQLDGPYVGRETDADVVEDEDSEEENFSQDTRFKDNNDGTVTDTETGLMWTKDANFPPLTRLIYQALDYVEKMNEGEYPNFGFTDWRLPTVDELRSLIDYTKLTREGHTLPKGHPFDNVKSMTVNSYLYTTDHTWFASLYCRLFGRNVQFCVGYVWPVRGGQGNIENPTSNSQ